jgi:hypothetical protein
VESAVLVGRLRSYHLARGGRHTPAAGTGSVTRHTMQYSDRVPQTNYNSLPLVPGDTGLMRIGFLDEDSGEVVVEWNAESAPTGTAQISEWFYSVCTINPPVWWCLQWLTPYPVEDQTEDIIHHTYRLPRDNEQPHVPASIPREACGPTGEIFFGFRAAGTDEVVCLWEHPDV